VPLTRHHDSAALQFELELARLDQLDQFRERGVDTGEETGNWMRRSANPRIPAGGRDPAGAEVPQASYGRARRREGTAASPRPSTLTVRPSTLTVGS